MQGEHSVGGRGALQKGGGGGASQQGEHQHFDFAQCSETASFVVGRIFSCTFCRYEWALSSEFFLFFF